MASGRQGFKGNEGPGSGSLDGELLPLSLAAQVVYSQINGVRGDVADKSALEEVVRLTALALSHIAPIYSMSTEGRPQLLAPQQLDEVLSRLMREKADPPDLELFQIRRGDLRRALTSLRNTRSAI